MFEFKDVPGRRVVKNVVVLLSKGLPDGLIIRVQRHPVKKRAQALKKVLNTMESWLVESIIIFTENKIYFIITTNNTRVTSYSKPQRCLLQWYICSKMSMNLVIATLFQIT